MGKIEQTLKKIKGDIKPLLIEMFPEMRSEIDFAYEDDFKEWFGMLLDLRKWVVHPDMIFITADKLVLNTDKLNQTKKELNRYHGIKDYGFISTVLIENDLHLIDGYHRVLVARGIGIAQLRGCIWEKAQNVHPNCAKIKNLIINNL